MVRILPGKNCCQNAQVKIGSEICGNISGTLREGYWYTLKCKKQPLKGEQVVIASTTNSDFSIV